MLGQLATPELRVLLFGERLNPGYVINNFLVGMRPRCGLNSTS